MHEAKASIKLLLEDPSKETAELIKEAQEQYDSEYPKYLLEYIVSQLHSQILPEF